VIFLFQGGYIPGRGIDKLLEVFKQLERRNSKVVLVFLVYGEGAEELKEKVKESSNIYWHEKVSPLEYMKYVSSADWGIYLMENICLNHDFALPNKIFDYILGGLPVVVSDLKEMSKLVNEYDIGYTVDTGDIEGILKLLEKFDKNKKKKFQNNLKEVAKKYCWEEQEKVLLKIYDVYRYE
jgi:glycosyltransferase involved in cell wall biosynthesis